MFSQNVFFNVVSSSIPLTGDSNWILFAIIGAILLLAIAGLITYYVVKKKKDSKKNTYKPKH